MYLRIFFILILCTRASCLFTEQVAEEQRCALLSPLTTFAQATETITANARAIQALIEVPTDAPDDLGVGAFVKDDDGNWFQLAKTQSLKPGIHHLHFELAQQENWQAEPHFHTWNPYRAQLAHNYGLFFWSAQHSNSEIVIKHIRSITQDVKPAPLQRVVHIQQDQLSADGSYCQGQTGERWSLRCEIDSLPSNPYDSDIFQLDLAVSGPDGDYVVPGFYEQPMLITDGGDKDRTIINGSSFFRVRFRPRLPGTYQIKLIARWNKETEHEVIREIPLAPLQVTGEPWDEYVRVDEQDYRFFRVGVEKRFHWPLGMNIRSVTDPRATQRTRTKITPDRIVQAYTAYFDRLSRAGANSCEIWMASWNVGLEWLDDWPGFHGIGAYHEGNAKRLDAILDAAYERGIRVILVINNHGQASFKTDREWLYSPFNIKNGGPLEEAKDFFTHEVPLHAQQERRRYIVARYADHPAIMCWKVFSEMNLTDMARNGSNGKEQMRIWHDNAFKEWKALDIYDHPVTSHWSGDYRVPFRDLVALESMDFTAIDAYHGRRGNRGRLLANIMYNSTLHPELGLSAYKKPLVCTEFGASSGAGPEPQLIAEHMSGPWAALMSGHGSSPHLWWYEWVDQGDRFHPFRAISQYLAGEDLRDPKARCVHLKINSEKLIWSRAWFKPGCIYGYLLDWDWGYDGVAAPLHQNVQLHIGNQVQAGTMEIEWWDASIGHRIQQKTFKHQGGPLIIPCIPFRRHLAFKLRRISHDVKAP